MGGERGGWHERLGERGWLSGASGGRDIMESGWGGCDERSNQIQVCGLAGGDHYCEVSRRRPAHVAARVWTRRRFRSDTPVVVVRLFEFGVRVSRSFAELAGRTGGRRLSIFPERRRRRQRRPAGLRNAPLRRQPTG